MAQEDHWLPGFNFNVEEFDAEGADLGDVGDLPHARPGPCRVRRTVATDQDVEVPICYRR